jgi:hypothetical protein
MKEFSDSLTEAAFDESELSSAIALDGNTEIIAPKNHRDIHKKGKVILPPFPQVAFSLINPYTNFFQ